MGPRVGSTHRGLSVHMRGRVFGRVPRELFASAYRGCLVKPGWGIYLNVFELSSTSPVLVMFVEL